MMWNWNVFAAGGSFAWMLDDLVQGKWLWVAFWAGMCVLNIVAARRLT